MKPKPTYRFLGIDAKAAALYFSSFVKRCNQLEFILTVDWTQTPIQQDNKVL